MQLASKTLYILLLVVLDCEYESTWHIPVIFIHIIGNITRKNKNLSDYIYLLILY